MKKRLFFLIVTVLVVLGYGAVIANAESGTCGENVTWDLTDGVMTISGSGPMEDYSSTEDVPWRAIRTNINSVVVEEGVTSIGTLAFYGCTKNTQIILPETVESIGYYAFGYNHYVTDLVLPDSITDISMYAFANCYYLQSVKLPENLTYVYFYVFQGCVHLTDVVLPSKCETVESYAFEGCTSLESITLPPLVMDVYGDTFKDCTSLENVFVDKSNAYLTSVDGIVFSKDKTELYIYPNGKTYTEYSVPYGVTTIAGVAFSGNQSLRYIYFPYTLTEIKWGAFENCTRLREVNVSAQTYVYGSDVFYGCTSLEAINVEEGNELVSSVDGVLFDNDKTQLWVYPTLKAGSSYVIPDTVTMVLDKAFENCENLKSVEIPRSVVNIGSNAFNWNINYIYYHGSESEWNSINIHDDNEAIEYANITYDYSPETDVKIISEGYCGDTATYILYSDGLLKIEGEGEINYNPPWDADKDYIKEVVISEGITRIPGGTFFECVNLGKISLPDSLNSLEDNALYGCISLTEVKIPKNVKELGGSVFEGCASLSKVVLLCKNAEYSSNMFYECPNLKTAGPIGSGCNIEFSWTEKIPRCAFWGCGSLTSVTVPSGVTIIEEGAFSGCKALGEIVIPDKVTVIESSAFSGCDSLVCVVIPVGVISLGSGAFSGCDILESVAIPETVTSIGSGCFFECRKLKNVNIPKNIAKIEARLFYDCEGLTYICIPSGVTSIGSSAFSGCSALEQIDMPKHITELGERVFAHCDNLKSVEINGNIDRLKCNMFYKCYSIESIILPNTLTAIEKYAFTDCNSLKYIEIPTSITEVGEHAFLRCEALESEIVFDRIDILGEHAFASCSAKIRATVNTDLPLCAFKGSGIESIIMLSGVTKIELDALMSCDNLKSVSIPDSVTEIGRGAVSHCDNLETATIGKNALTLGIDIFYSCDKLNSVILPEGITQIPDYMFYDCVSLETITIPQSVTRIGEYAFEHCISLHSVTMYDNVETIGERAFRECNDLQSIRLSNNLKGLYYACFDDSGLTSIIIPEGVTHIGGCAFDFCRSMKSIYIPKSVTSVEAHAARFTDLEVVYYGGTEEEWNALINSKYFDRIYNGELIGAEKVFNQYIPQTTIDNNEGIEINYKGKAYGRFTLRRSDGTLVVNESVTYKIEGFDKLFTAKTDYAGVVIVTTPEMIGDWDKATVRTINVTFPDLELEKDVYSFNVLIRGLTYSQKWEGALAIGGEIGVGFGVGASLGPVELEAKLAEAGISGKAGKTLTVEHSYEDGVRNLILRNAATVEAAANAKVGVFASAEVCDIGAEANASVGTGASAGGKTQAVLNIENYDPNNMEHIKKIAYFLVDCTIDPNALNVAKKIAFEILGESPTNESGRTTSIAVEGGASVGASLGVVDATLVGINGGSAWRYDVYKDKNDNVEYTSSIEANAGVKIAEIGIGIESDAGESEYKAEMSGGGVAIYEEDFINHNIEISAKEQDNITIKMLEESNNYKYFFHKDSTDYYNQFILSGSQVGIATAENPALNELKNGERSFFTPKEMVDTVSNVMNSELIADYEKGVEYSSLDSYIFNLGVEAIIQLGVMFEFSTLSQYGYAIQGGRLENGVLYITSDSHPEEIIESTRKSLTRIMEEPTAVVLNILVENLETVKNSIDNGVEWSKAKIEGFGQWVGSITGFGSYESQSFEIMGINSDTELFEEVGVATTVGMPYIITLSDNENNVVELENGEATLTISYDDADLKVAGLANDESMLKALGIYRWDEEKNLYVCMGGEVDFENSCVTIPLQTSGQYILAIDTKSPVISNFKASNATARPVISANVSDMSGIKKFEFSIDGVVYVNDENLEEFYSATTGNFTLIPDFDLADGDHTASISVYDTTGSNAETYEEILFTVNATAPEIVSVDIPNEVYVNSVTVTAEVTDDDISTVFAYVEYDSNVYTYQMNACESIYTAEINNLPSIGKIVVWIAAYDIAGNKASSEKMLVLFHDSSEEEADEIGIEVEATDSNAVKVSVVNFGDTLTGKLIVAGYNAEGVLGEAQSATMITNGKYTETELKFENEYVLYKVFYWDDTEKMIPLCDVSVLE